MINLIGNAFKYTKEGFIKISAEHAIIEDKDYVKISIKDSGIGIKKEDFKNMF